MFLSMDKISVSYGPSMSESHKVKVTASKSHFTALDSEYQGGNQEGVFLTSNLSDPYTLKNIC